MGQAGGNLKAGGGVRGIGAGGECVAEGRDSDPVSGDFKGLQGGKFPSGLFGGAPGRAAGSTSLYIQTQPSRVRSRELHARTVG